MGIATRLLRKLSCRTAESVTASALQLLSRRCAEFKTITFDNGTEFHGYKTLEDRFALKCYFATPYHSWERGTNENLNGLIRQFIPKKVSMSTVTQAYCDAVASRLNFRPRKAPWLPIPSGGILWELKIIALQL